MCVSLCACVCVRVRVFVCVLEAQQVEAAAVTAAESAVQFECRVAARRRRSA